MIEKKEQDILLKDVREQISAILEHRAPQFLPFDSPQLAQRRGAFVTLRRNGALRGCIGHIRAIAPLREAIRELACSSAFEDPRFPALTLAELEDLEIEISVLTTLQEVAGPEEFHPGHDGILIDTGRASAVFLPQVAEEQGWDRNQTLSHLCLKAGLRPMAWTESGMRFFTFQAQVFS
jgi:hypothetical protein